MKKWDWDAIVGGAIAVGLLAGWSLFFVESVLVLKLAAQAVGL